MTLSHEEARDAEIAKRTEQRYAAWTAKLDARDPRAMSDLQNVILDHLSADEAKELFAKAATDKAEVGDRLAMLVRRFMYDECEADAIKQVEQMERDRKQAADEERAEQALLDRV
jgi:hypothetical protein